MNDLIEEYRAFCAQRDIDTDEFSVDDYLRLDSRMAHSTACETGRRIVRNHCRPLEPEIRVEEPFVPTYQRHDTCRYSGEDLSDTLIYEDGVSVMCDNSDPKPDFSTEAWHRAWSTETARPGAFDWDRVKRDILIDTFAQAMPTPRPVLPPGERLDQGEREAYDYLTREFFYVPAHYTCFMPGDDPETAAWRFIHHGFKDYIYLPDALNIDIIGNIFARIRRKIAKSKLSWFK